MEKVWRNTCATLAMATWLMGACPASAQPALQHDLTVRLEPLEHRLQATDVVTLSQLDVSSLDFDLAQVLNIDRLAFNGQIVPYSFVNGRIHVPLPRYSESGRLRIDYGGIFNDAAPEDLLNTDNPGFGVTGTISERGTMLLAGAQWYPASWDAYASYRITVDAPKGLVAVTSGRPLGHVFEAGRTVSRWVAEHPLQGLPLVAGPYDVSSLAFDGVTAATYFSKPLQPLSDEYLKATGKYLQFYQELFGDYPYEQFAVVENFFPTGYGFPSFTLIGGRVLALPFIIHTSLGHEIAHCWWGNGVFVEPSQGNWSEGLTTYVSDYLFKERRGEGRIHRLQWLRNYASLVDSTNDFPVAQFKRRNDAVTKVVGYDKAAMVFHMLRQTVGDETFWQVLRDIYSRYRFKAIAWSDFKAAFELRAGISLEPFFRQWVYQAGAPRLALSRVTVTPTGSGYDIRGTVIQEKPFYDLQLKLTLAAGKHSMSQSLMVSGPRTPFLMSANDRPHQLTADPDVDVFRRLAPEEVPPTINALKGAPRVTVVVARDLGSDGLDIAKRLSLALGLKQVRIGQEGDFGAQVLAHSDLLLVGKPSNVDVLFNANAQFALQKGAFMLNGRNYAGTRSSFFGVFPHPDNRAYVLGCFFPDNLSDGMALIAKIPHYGKYSYLVFKTRINQIKGTWAAEASPLVVRWAAPSKGKP